MENMPTHDDIMDFSNKIARLRRERCSRILDPAGLRWSAPRSPHSDSEPTMFFPDDLGIAPPVKHLPVVS